MLLLGKRLREHIKNIKYVIVDEVHEMAQNERGSQFAIAMERLKVLAGNFQVIGLSATAKNEDELSLFISPSSPCKILKPVIDKKMDIKVILPPPSNDDIANIMACDNQYAGSIEKIHSIVEENKGTIVFVNRRYVAEDISFRLRLWGINIIS